MLPHEALIPTSEVDHANWNYRPVLGNLQKKRFGLALSLMGDDRYERLLEIGYGSGVFMPELATRCGELYGVDPHARNNDVTDVLSDHGIRASLASAGATKLPFDDSFFDCVVTVSALEYVEEIHTATAELARVMSPTGALIVVTPGHSRLIDLALRVTTGEDADDNYADRRQKLVPALLRRFRLDGEKRFPAIGLSWALYRALRLTPKA